MRDSASVNNVAVRTLKIAFPLLFYIGCFTHALDHVGENINTRILDPKTKGCLLSVPSWCSDVVTEKLCCIKSRLEICSTRMATCFSLIVVCFFSFETSHLLFVSAKTIAYKYAGLARSPLLCYIRT